MNTKQYYITSFIITILFSGCKPIDNIGYYDERFKGKPKKIEMTSYELVNKNNVIKKGKVKRTEVYLFDKKNRLYKSYTIKNEADSIPSKCQNYYFEKEKIVEFSCIENDNLEVKYRTFFNKKNQKTKINSYSKTKLTNQRIFKYLENNRDYIDYGYGNGVLKDKTLVKQDKQNRILKIISFDNPSGDSIRNIIDNRYNKSGDNIETEYYRKGKELYKTIKKKYDQHNNLIYTETITKKDKDTIISDGSIIYKYDKKGNITYKEIILNKKTIHIEERKVYY